MFKYQLHKLSKGGRKARAVLLEDILTSDVFGMMSYLPYNTLLKQFIDMVKMKNPSARISVPDSEPVKISFWKSFLWPTDIPYLDRNTIEPDVVIEWESLLLIVEAKFISPTDPEELLREYLVGLNEMGKKQDFFLLLIDKNLSIPEVSKKGDADKLSIGDYISGRIKELKLISKYSSKKLSKSLLWINWQSFYVLVAKLLNKGVLGKAEVAGYTERKLLQDLLLILERKDLIPFETLILNKFSNFKIDLNSLEHLGNMIQGSLIGLSDISIDVTSLGRIGQMVRNPIDLSDISIDVASLGRIGQMVRNPIDLSGISIDVTSLGRIGQMVRNPLLTLSGLNLEFEALDRQLPL